MKKNYRVLHLEDDINDAKLVKAALEAAGFCGTITLVEDKLAFQQQLEQQVFDVVLIDCQIPEHSVLGALKQLFALSDAPAIIVSGAIGDEQAVGLIRAGAIDYVLKDNLVRLANTVDRAVLEYRAAKEQQAQEALHEQLINSTHAGMFKTNTKGQCLYVNQQLCQLTGFLEKALLEGGWTRCLFEEDKQAMQLAWRQGIQNGTAFQVEGRLRTAMNNIIWIQCHCSPEIENGVVLGFIGTIVDITDLKKAQQKLRYIAHLDMLTNLPNRRALKRKLEETLDQIKRKTISSIVLIYIDLDHFKKINDTLGHAVGDILLQQAAIRFQQVLRPSDFIARVGGDEFVILVDFSQSARKIHHLTTRLLTQFQQPFMIEGRECITTLSMGVVTVLEDAPAVSADELIQHSDQALYRAKAKGRNYVEYYTDSLNQDIQRIVALENDMRNAVKKGEFSLVYQPQINIVSGQIVGCEALIRWQHPRQGYIAPDVFIPIAEETQLITPISEWVVTQSFRQWQQWQQQFPSLFNPQFMLSINLSPLQFEHQSIKHVTHHLTDLMAQYQTNPNMVTFELTETAVMSNIERMKDIFQAFANIGVCVAIDDFGTGYSSLSYLKELPLNSLKIDKSFVQDLEKSASSQAIVRGILALADALNLNVIAEGIETKAQADFLRQHGCSYGQGYYFAKPMSAEKFTAMLHKQVS